MAVDYDIAHLSLLLTTPTPLPLPSPHTQNSDHPRPCLFQNFSHCQFFVSRPQTFAAVHATEPVT